MSVQNGVPTTYAASHRHPTTFMGPTSWTTGEGAGIEATTRSYLNEGRRHVTGAAPS